MVGSDLKTLIIGKTVLFTSWLFTDKTASENDIKNDIKKAIKLLSSVRENAL